MPPFGLAPGGARRKLWPAAAFTRLNGGASRSLTDIKTNCIISRYCRKRLRPGPTRISPFRAGHREFRYRLLKTSLVIVATTRSGLGVTQPRGELTASYGTFGTSNEAFSLATGGQTWGNFVAVNGLNTGRFLDPPEFTVMHDKGNEENVFDRIDLRPLDSNNAISLNLQFTRSWFQNPNSFDQEYQPGVVNPVTGAPLGPADQRSQIKTYNFAPSWTRTLNPHTVLRSEEHTS